MSTDNSAGSGEPQRFALANDRAAEISAFVIRIVAGLVFAQNLYWKIPPYFGSDNDSGLYFIIGQAIDYPVVGPFTSFIENVVLPNFGLFAWGIYLVEIGLAVFLILGLATRLWAAVGVAVSTSIFLIVGATPGVWNWSYFLMMATLFAVFGTAAGRVVGLDAVLRSRATGTSLAARLYRIVS